MPLLTPKIISGFTYIQTPLYSFDGQYLFLISRYKIHIFNVKTGKCLGILKPKSEYDIEEFFIGAHIYIKCKLQLITMTNTGKITLWNYTNGREMKTCRINLCNIENFFHTSNNLYFVIPNQNKNIYDVAYMNLPIFQDPKENLQIDVPTKYFRLLYEITKESYCLTFHPLNYFIAAVVGNELKLHKMVENCLTQSIEPQYLTHLIGSGRFFTSITTHPTQMMVATGDNTGRIIIWNNVTTRQPIKTIYHWHTFPLYTLIFSTEGSYLLSGGKEKVLVKWNLKHDGDKQFLPYFDSEITNINVSKNNETIAVSLKNNSVKVVGFQFDFPQCLNVSGLLIEHGRLPQINLNDFLEYNEAGEAADITESYHTYMNKKLSYISMWDVGIVWDAKLLSTSTSPSLVTNGPTGYIQGYDLTHSQLLYQLDICHQNAYTGTRYVAPNNTQVTKAAFYSNTPNPAHVGSSSDEKSQEPSNVSHRLRQHHYLVTFQYRDPDLMLEELDAHSPFVTPESYLKFWEYNPDLNSYVLNTSIFNPHGFEPIMNLLFLTPFSREIDVELSSAKISDSDGELFPTLLTISSQTGDLKLWSPSYELIPGTIDKFHYTWACKHASSYSYGYKPTKSLDYHSSSGIVAIAWQDDGVKDSNLKNNKLIFNLNETADTEMNNFVTEKTHDTNVITLYGFQPLKRSNLMDKTGPSFYDQELVLLDDSIAFDSIYEGETIQYVKICEKTLTGHNQNQLILVACTTQRILTWAYNDNNANQYLSLKKNTQSELYGLWRLLWSYDFERDKLSYDMPTPCKESYGPYSQTFVTAFDCNLANILAFSHNLYTGPSAIIFSDILNGNLKQIINLPYVNLTSSTINHVKSAKTKNKPVTLSRGSKMLSKLFENSKNIIEHCSFIPCLDSMPTSQIYFFDSDQQLFTFHETINEGATVETPHIANVSDGESLKSQLMLPEDPYDLLNFNLIPFKSQTGNLSTQATTPFGALIMREKAFKRQTRNESESSMNDDLADYNLKSEEHPYDPLNKNRNLSKSQQSTSAKLKLELAKKQAELNNIVETCNAHTFPELGQFSQLYLETFLMPKSILNGQNGIHQPLQIQSFDAQYKNNIKHVQLTTNISDTNDFDFKELVENELGRQLLNLTNSRTEPSAITSNSLKSSSRKRFKTNRNLLPEENLETSSGIQFNKLKAIINELF